VGRAVLANQFVRTARRSADASELDRELALLDSWEGFSINAVCRHSQGRPLQAVGQAAFERYGLLVRLGVPTAAMQRFLATVESHYL